LLNWYLLFSYIAVFLADKNFRIRIARTEQRVIFAPSHGGFDKLSRLLTIKTKQILLL